MIEQSDIMLVVTQALRHGGMVRRVSSAVLHASINHPLLRHGEGLAFVGLGLGAACYVLTRRGRDGGPPSGYGYSSGRYLGAFFLRWPLLILGVVGLLMMAAAVA